MAEPKWTPGPWEVERWQSGDLWIVARHSHHIARMMNNIYIPTEQKEADAHLIAAAPDLYDACEIALEAVKVEAKVQGRITPRLVGAANTIKQALRKARGEE